MANNLLECIAEADTALVESSDCTVEETAVESSDCNAGEKMAAEDFDCTVVVEGTAFHGENCCVQRHIHEMWHHEDVLQAVLRMVLGNQVEVLCDRVEVLGSAAHGTKSPDSPTTFPIHHPALVPTPSLLFPFPSLPWQWSLPTDPLTEECLLVLLGLGSVGYRRLGYGRWGEESA